MTTTKAIETYSVDLSDHEDDDEDQEEKKEVGDQKEVQDTDDEELGKKEKQNAPPDLSLAPSNTTSTTTEESHMDPALHIQSKEEIMEQRALRKNFDKRCACIMIQAGLLALIIAIALAITYAGKNSNGSQSGGATNLGDSLEEEEEDSFRAYLPPVTLEALKDPTSPQSQAYDWFVAARRRYPSTNSGLEPERVQQRFALATLYFATGGRQWNKNTSTGGAFLSYNRHECEWMPAGRLSCNAEGQLTKINLSQVGLSGTLPPEFFLLLQRVESLDLSENDLSGALPNQILTMTQLQELDLHSNPELSGHVSPYGINLERLSPNLKDLDIQNTGISGILSDGLCSSVIDLAFTCNANLLCGCGCPCAELRDDILALLPDYSQEALLDDTSAQSSALAWLFQDPNLEDYTNHQRLQRFAVATLYYAMHPTAPSEEASSSLSLWKNETNWLSADHHECDFAGIVECETRSMDSEERRVITLMNLGQNGMQGTIPPEVALLTDLQELSVAYNDLTGPLPSEVGLLTNLVTLDVSWNQLIRNIPTTIGQLTNLEVLRLNDNRFHSHIPDQIGYLRRLKAISLHDNDMITGRIPNVMIALPFLETLTVNATFVSGRIPSALCMLENFAFTCSPFLCGCGDCICED